MNRQHLNNGARRSLAHADWPNELADCWETRIVRSDPFGHDPLPLWSSATKECLRRAVSRYLGYVNNSEPERLSEAALLACDPAVLVHYTAELRITCRDTSVASYLLRLGIAFRRLFPAQDYTLLFRAARLIGANAPRLHRPIVLAPQLHRLALEELDSACTLPVTMRSACSFRTALMIGLLTEAPMRVGSFSKLELSDLTKVAKTWQIYIRPEWAKRKKSADYQLSEPLSHYLSHYLSDIRPTFRDAVVNEALWLGQTGGALSSQRIAMTIGDYTEMKLGTRISPHGFRRAAGAFIAHKDPENVLVVRDLLNHESFSTTERHYLPAARTRRAGRMLANVLGIEL